MIDLKKIQDICDRQNQLKQYLNGNGTAVVGRNLLEETIGNIDYLLFAMQTISKKSQTNILKH